jgi:hypothetical protein
MNNIKPINRPVKTGEFVCKVWFMTFAGAVWAIVLWMLYLAITA